MRLISFLILTAVFLNLLHAQDPQGYRIVTQENRPGQSFRLTVTSADGKRLYEIDRRLPVDTSPPGYHLFADGSVLLMDAFAGVWEHYGPNGKMSERRAFSGRIEPNHERIGFLGGTDSLAVLLISDADREECRLIGVNDRGQQILDQTVGGSFASGLMVSQGGNRLALGVYSWEGSALRFSTQFRNIDGVFLSSLNIDFKGGAWGPGDSMAVVFGKDHAEAVEVVSGKVLASTAFAPGTVVHQVFWQNRTPLLATSPPPTIESGAWVYRSVSILNLVTGTTLFQSSASPFRTVNLQGTAAGVSVAIDGRTVSLIPPR